MTIELTTRDRRDRDALIYFLNAATWQHKVTLRDGRKVYGLPSRTTAGLFHLTDGSECSCKDWTSRQPTGGCAHMRAAVLYRMERAAEEARKRKTNSRYASIFGPDNDKPYCTACRRHHDTNMHYFPKVS